MKTVKIQILGVSYELNTDVTDEEYPFGDNCCGVCDYSVKKLYIKKFDSEAFGSIEDPKWYVDKVIRHEVIHAMLIESGLCENSDWADNEEMVDFFACQYPKLAEIFDEIGI